LSEDAEPGAHSGAAAGEAAAPGGVQQQATTGSGVVETQVGILQGTTLLFGFTL
jgi:hypothetical protein